MLSIASLLCNSLKFGGDLNGKFRRRLEMKRLDLTWSGQIDQVDLTAANLRFIFDRPWYIFNTKK